MDVRIQPGARVQPQEHEAVLRQPREARAALPEKPQTAPASVELSGLTERMNEAVNALNQSLKFEFSEHNNVIIKLVDTRTNEVIREIPPESLVRAFEHMQELMGILLDRKL